jgi:hypothetical protein
MFLIMVALNTTSNQQAAIALFRVGLGLIFLTFIIGRTFRRVIYPSLSSLAPSTIALDFFLSISLVSVTALVLGCTKSLNFLNVASSVFILYAIFLILGLLRQEESVSVKPFTLSKLMIIEILLIGVVGVALAALLRSGFSYPQMPGWDVYVHLAAEGSIVQNNGYPSPFMYSPGFLPYPNSLYFWVSSYSFLLDVSLFNINNMAVFFLFPFFGTVVYLLASQLHRNHYLCLTASLIALATPGGEALLGPQYLFPSVIAMLLFVLLLTFLADPTSYLSRRKLLLLIWMLSFLLLFYYFAVFVVFPVAVVLIYGWRSSRKLSYNRKSSRLALGLTMLFALGTMFVSSVVLPYSSLALSIEQKTQIITAAYSPLLLVLLLVGLFFGFFRKIKITIRTFTLSWERASQHLLFDLLDLSLFCVFILIAYYLPSQGGYRSELFGRPLFAIVAASLLGFVWLDNDIGKHINSKSREKLIRRLKKVVKPLAVLAIVLLSIPQFAAYSDQLPSMSNVSVDEYSAATWIRNNTSTNDYILTDPSTGFILRGLTLRNSSTSFLLDGHPVADHFENLSNLTYSFFVSTDPIKCKELLSEMPLQPKYVVITTRTSSWVTWGGFQSVFTSPPVSFQSWLGYQKFGSELFTLIESWGNVGIYKIKSFEIRPLLVLDTTKPSSFYLDGDFGNYSQSVEIDGSLTLFAQSRTSSSAWTGLVYKNISLINSDYFSIKYRVSNPASSLLLIFRAENLTALKMVPLEQKTDWSDLWISVDDQIGQFTEEIDVLIYTQDTDFHTMSIKELGGYDLMIND